MLTAIEAIKESIVEYIGSGMYISLYLVGLVYIWLSEKNSKIRNFFVLFSILVLLIVLNPIFCKIVSNVITSNIYWRMFWLLPIGLTITYCSTKIIIGYEGLRNKVALFIVAVIIIMISGKFIYTGVNYIKVDNWYKIPQEALEICVAISEDNLEKKIIIAPPKLIPYFRQYSANLYLMYGRVPTGYDDNELVIALNNGDMRYLIPICLKEKCNYIVIDKNVVIDNYIIESGYSILGQTVNYIIYKFVE